MTVRSIIVPPHALAVGVDMHAHSHLFAVLPAKTGRLIDTKGIPTGSAGINRAIAGALRRTVADLAALRVTEWVVSCGDILAGAVAAEVCPAVEAARMDARAPRGVGKPEIVAPGIARACSRWRSSDCAAHGRPTAFARLWGPWCLHMIR